MAMSKKDSGAIKYAIVCVAIGISYVIGWAHGFSRGLNEAVQTESGVITLTGLPERTLPYWTEAVGAVLLVGAIVAFAAWAVTGGVPPRVR